MNCKAQTKAQIRCKNKAGKNGYCFRHSTPEKTTVAKKSKSSPNKESLYDRLGGAFAIAAVINKFSDDILANPKVGVDSPNPQLRKWSRSQLDRLPGLKFMRTLWVCSIAGGPQSYAGTKPGPEGQYDLSEAHRSLKITSDEFDEVAKILSNTLKFYKVPIKEMNEVLGAFSAHKKDIVRKLDA